MMIITIMVIIMMMIIIMTSMVRKTSGHGDATVFVNQHPENKAARNSERY